MSGMMTLTMAYVLCRVSKICFRIYPIYPEICIGSGPSQNFHRDALKAGKSHQSAVDRPLSPVLAAFFLAMAGILLVESSVTLHSTRVWTGNYTSIMDGQHKLPCC